MHFPYLHHVFPYRVRTILYCTICPCCACIIRHCTVYSSIVFVLCLVALNCRRVVHVPSRLYPPAYFSSLSKYYPRLSSSVVPSSVDLLPSFTLLIRVLLLLMCYPDCAPVVHVIYVPSLTVLIGPHFNKVPSRLYLFHPDYAPFLLLVRWGLENRIQHSKDVAWIFTR